MKKNNVAETLVANPVEELLLRAVIDPEFRSEILTNPEAFGIPTNTETLVFLHSVAQQDMSFVELVNDSTNFAAPGSDNCRCTCVTGFTLKCDGTSM